MSWIDETLKNVNSSDSTVGKNDVKECIRIAAIELIKSGFDWDDVEIYLVAKIRPLVGEFIILFHKWVREVKDEEKGVTVN